MERGGGEYFETPLSKFLPTPSRVHLLMQRIRHEEYERSCVDWLELRFLGHVSAKLPLILAEIIGLLPLLTAPRQLFGCFGLAACRIRRAVARAAAEGGK